MINSRSKFPKDKYPFSDELCNFMDKNPEFFESLKIANLKKFIFIPIIIISHTPKKHALSNDEIIGMWYYDKQEKIYKQDFIVNKGANNIEYISFTAKDTIFKLNAKSKYVKINKLLFL